jgi:predicted metal-dependent TIM-barrel fold hydrolase
MQVSGVQEVVENGFKTKIMIIDQAASYCDIVREVTEFLDKKAKCCYSQKVTVAISVKFPVPKEYSDELLGKSCNVTEKSSDPK